MWKKFQIFTHKILGDMVRTREVLRTDRPTDGHTRSHDLYMSPAWGDVIKGAIFVVVQIRAFSFIIIQANCWNQNVYDIISVWMTSLLVFLTYISYLELKLQIVSNAQPFLYLLKLFEFRVIELGGIGLINFNLLQFSVI